MVKEKKRNTEYVKENSKKKPEKTKVKKTVVKKLKVKKMAVMQKKTEAKPAKTPVRENAPVKEPEVKSSHPALIYKKYDNKITDFYGDTRIVLLPRDAYWLFAYWEVALPRFEEAKQELGKEFKDSRSVLRVYEVTNIDFNGSNAHNYFDITLETRTISSYVKVPAPEKSWIAALGLLAPSGRFFILTVSNSMSTPGDGISDSDEEEWLDASEESRTRITKVKKEKGGGRSDGLYEEERSFFYSVVGSAVESSLSGTVKYENKPSAFWLRVGTELLVYGAAEPGATVAINGTQIALNKDGSYSSRFELGSGMHLLEISGRSANSLYKKTFQIKVIQNTRKVD
ncbi:MAG: DUF4912 domain-containing protein [Candidatus Firestonebacteria bacterium]|nr:DUF4912 domain-containing protein [Candidatus Firestonebacteria bacterium]